jgi:hypothetical protein
VKRFHRPSLTYANVVQVERSGAARSAASSSSSRNVTKFRRKRFVGIASARSIDPACSGWRRAANWSRERIAANRALRVPTALPRAVSR